MSASDSHENSIRVRYIWRPAWEMFFSMHVLANPTHHPSRKRWAQTVREANPELTGEITAFSDQTASWTFLIDSDSWMTLKDQSIPNVLKELEHRNIYRWNEMTAGLCPPVTLPDKDRIRRVISRYYHDVFQAEEPILRERLLSHLKEEQILCHEIGLRQWCRTVHPRLRVEGDRLIFMKNREYSYSFRDIREISVSVSSFLPPHLWLYERNGHLEIIKGIQAEKEPGEIPDDFVSVFRALGDRNRLRIVQELIREPLTTREIAGRLGLTEAAVSRHLKLLGDAGLVEKSRDGKQVPYRFRREIVDYLPYSFYEWMLR